MTLEQAITKAIEGGYKMPEITRGWVYDVQFNLILLDPSFWQSLGKAMGWAEEKDNAGEMDGDGKWHHTTTLGSWLNNWHLFIEFLAEGRTAEEFFEKLN